MSPERWQQITDVFESALGREGGARASFLAAACANDPSLRQEVEAMLAAHEEAGAFLAEPALTVVARQSASGGASLAGETLAHYQVLTLLGTGGMGDVYLAQDLRLGRKVALKLLPDYLAGDAQRNRLFTREARAASALNHPNIITVYEIGQLGQRYYIAMEYVDGVTLREKIHRERTPLPKLLQYLQQAAEGLTKAHAAGIVHRDLKPDNIMITRDGYAKVLDFGLAKLAGMRNEEAETLLRSPQDNPPVPIQNPQSIAPGVVMGTIGYMSPEQAQGRAHEIDHRSDIFSFGCILYEAATARRAFEGEDLLGSLNRIIHGPAPQVREANPQAPAELERIVRRCLMKDPEERYQSTKDLAIELEELQQKLKDRVAQGSPRSTDSGRPAAAEDEGAAGLARRTRTTARRTSSVEHLARGLRRHKTWIALVVLIIGLGLTLFLLRRGGTGQNGVAARPVAHFETMQLVRLTTSGRALSAAISPDGKYVAYLKLEFVGSVGGSAGTASIWVRQVATGRDIKIVEPGQFLVRGMTFSPDGNYLYYRVYRSGEPGQLFRVPVLGGDAQKVVANIYGGVSFSPDGRRIAFVRNHEPAVGDSNVLIANADGTNERIIATHRGGELFATPSRPTTPAWSPDGKVLVCALGTYNGDTSLLEVQVEGGAEKLIGPKRWSWIDSISWTSDGGSLMLTARDQSSAQLQIWQAEYPSGEAHRVTNDLNEYQGMSLTADSNTMVVVQTARDADIWLMPAGRPAEARALTSGTGKADGNWGLSWTPDGKLVYGSNASGNRDIWLMDISRGVQKQLTADAHQNFYPVVTPDGRYIIFSSDRGEAFGLWRMDIDGGNPRQLVAAPILGHAACSPDGKWVVYSSTGRKGIPGLWKVGVDGGDPLLIDDEYWEELPRFSPDGKQITFQYFEVGRSNLNLGQIPLEGGPITRLAQLAFRLSPTMRWTPDAGAIAYIDNREGTGNIWALPTGGGGPPRQLTDFKSDGIFWFDFSPDGRWLVLSRGTQISDVVLIRKFR